MTSINGNEIINKGNESFDLEIDENGAYVNANYQIIRLTLIPIINFDNDDNIYVNDDLSNLKEYISNVKELIISCFSSYNECLNYLEQINIQQKSIDSNKEYISNVKKFQSAIKTYNNLLFVLKKESFETILKKIFLEKIKTKQYFKYKVKDDEGNEEEICERPKFVEILKSEYKYDALNRVQHQKITSDKVNVCNEYSYLQQDNNSLDLISEDILKIEIDNNNQKSYLSETHTYEYDINF